ncbi:MAG: alpha-glucosidase [Clostridia bacterium]|nr:alpha-glucosidase [Clostridia bacterium]
MDNNQIKTRWYKDSVIYQIYPRSFADSNNDGIGDLKGITQKLDYVKSLGVDAIWLSPVYKSPNFDNGYDISDYYQINEEFGTMEDFEEFSRECKKREIKIIMDLVANHTSNEHQWFTESKKGKDNPFSDFYIWKKGKGKNGKKPPNNWSSRFSGPAWTYDENRKEWYLHLFTKQQPDLNWENPKVREEIVKICEFWFDKGVDGFRCDVLTYIAKDQSYEDGKYKIGLKGTEKFAMYGPWHEYVKELNDKSWKNHNSMIVAEGQDATFTEVKKATDENNGEIDTFFSFEHLTADTFFDYLPKKLDLVKFKKIINKWQQLPKENWNTIFLENHDLLRSVSRYIKGSEYYNIGAKMLCVFMMFQKGTPYVYQGQELGMTNCHFDYNEFRDGMAFQMFDTVKSVSKLLIPLAVKIMNIRGRDNARVPMQWDNTQNAGFNNEGSPTWIKVNPNKDFINVKMEESDKDSVLNFYKRVINFRKGNEIIKNGTYRDLDPKNKKLVIYERELNNEGYVVICNFSNKTINYRFKNFEYKSTNLEFYNIENTQKSLSKKIKILPYQTMVYCIKK